MPFVRNIKSIKHTVFLRRKKTSDNCPLPREVGAKSKRGFYAEKGIAMYSNLILDYGKGGRQGY